MTDSTPPSESPPSSPPPGASADPSKEGEIPLEDIERLLAEEDPEFAKEMAEMRSIETDANVVIESSVEGDTVEGEASTEVEGLSRVQKWRERFRLWRVSTRANLKIKMKAGVKASIAFLKTEPKRFAIWLFGAAKVGAVYAVIPLRAFRDSSRTRQLTILGLGGIAALTGWVLISNFKGIWIPHLTEPILGTFTPKADWVETYDTKDGGESFYSAFPQERHEFQFQKIKVNLRRDSEHANPMGAFEIVVQVDSKDSAIEIRDREVEFFDELQRIFEEESFSDLETEIGKARLKSRLKAGISQKLTQGWVREVNFKTFILKP